MGGNSLPVPCEAGTYNMEEMQTSCTTCPAGFICSPGGVVDYANGTFYATLGLHACADPEGGAREWVTQVGSNGTELAGSVAKDANDNIFVSGITSGSLDGEAHAGSFDVFVAKHDRGGRRLWTRLIGTNEDDAAEGLVVDDDGAVYVGVRQASGTSMVVKLDSCGDQGWNVTVGPLAKYSTLGLAQAGEYLHVSWKSKADNESYVSCLNLQGIQKWSSAVESAPSSLIRRISTDNDMNLYVLGEADGLNRTGFGGLDGFLVKLNSSGSVLWSRSFGTPSNDFVRGLDSDTTGVYVVGYT
ncbi:MAG: hypothetical protein ACPIOQ_68360, partial [Promethearchaeia archaeon]